MNPSVSSVTAGDALVAQEGPIRSLRSQDLAGAAGKEITMITVDYAPGASTPGHTHHAQTMLYVLEGSIVMQLKGSAPVTLTAGQTFYEGPDDVHVLAEVQEHHGRAGVLAVGILALRSQVLVADQQVQDLPRHGGLLVLAGAADGLTQVRRDHVVDLDAELADRAGDLGGLDLANGTHRHDASPAFALGPRAVRPPSIPPSDPPR